MLYYAQWDQRSIGPIGEVKFLKSLSDYFLLALANRLAKGVSEIRNPFHQNVRNNDKFLPYQLVPNVLYTKHLVLDVLKTHA